MNLLRCMPSVWLLNLFLKRIKVFVAIMLWYSILCLLYVLPQRTNWCTFLHIKEIKRWRKMLFKSKPLFRSQPKVLDGSKFVPTCHHCDVISHIRLQCHKLMREQNHIARYLPKKPSGPKHIVCHHCGAFGHLRPHCSKFHALKRI